MTISIEPARIVGAEVGDRVSYESPLDGPSVTWYGTIGGLSTEFPGRVVVNLEAASGACRHIAPDRLTLAPKKYKVGDRVDARDADILPNGTTICDSGMLPQFKISDTWYVVDPDTGTYPAALVGGRTIAWLPYTYLNS